MKCWKCGHELNKDQAYCDHCGALVKPTHKLLQAVAAGSEEAIIELYKISYAVINHELLSIGLSEEISGYLANAVYKDYVRKAGNIPLEEQYDQLIALSDHVGFSYMKDHGLEPHSVEHVDGEKQITRDMIDEMLENLHQKEAQIEKKPKKHKGIGILVGVIVLALVIGASYFGVRQVAKKDAKPQAKVQKGAYAAVVKEYVDGVNKATVDDSLSTSQSKLKKAYPRTYQSVKLAVKHKRTINELRCVMYEVNGDDVLELLIGYENGEGQFVITGIYHDHGQKKATNTNAIVSDAQVILLTKNHHVIRKVGSHYQLLTLNKKDHYQVSQTINDLNSYLKKQKTKTVSVKAKSTKTFYKEATGKSLTAYKNLPADDSMQKWLDAYQEKNYDLCNTLSEKMPASTEESATSSMSKAMKSAFKNVVQTYEDKYKKPVGSESLRGYYLTDLDGDGQVELLIAYADQDMMPYCDVYQYQNKTAKKVVNQYGYVESDGSRMSFHTYSGHPGMIGFYSHNGYEYTSILYLSGHQLKEKSVGGRDLHNMSGGFDEGVEIGMELPGHISGTSVDYSILN